MKKNVHHQGNPRPVPPYAQSYLIQSVAMTVVDANSLAFPVAHSVQALIAVRVTQLKKIMSR